LQHWKNAGVQHMIAEIAIHAKAMVPALQAYSLPFAQQSKAQPLPCQLLLQRITAGKPFSSSCVDPSLRLSQNRFSIVSPARAVQVSEMGFVLVARVQNHGVGAGSSAQGSISTICSACTRILFAILPHSHGNLCAHTGMLSFNVFGVSI